MVKTLRRKFILITMLVIFFVVGGIVGGINIVNYAKINGETDRVMQVLIENDGKMPMPKKENQGGDLSDQGKPPQDVFFGMQSETPFKVRYFTVTVKEDGSLFPNTENVFSVNDETAKEYVNAVINAKKTSGFYKEYKLGVKSLDSGTTYIFLDCAEELSSVKSILLTSLLLGGGAILLIFALILIFSKVAVAPIAESYEKQKRFITDANHELKTPLTIISASNEILELNYGENEWTKTIDGQINRLKELTEKLVFLSRMDEDDARINAAEFSLSSTVEEVASGFIPLSKTKNKTLTVSVQPDINYVGDEALIGQLVSILLDNAFKYSDDGGKICLSLFPLGKEKKLVVENTVEEIEKGNLDHLFERFYRTDKSRNSETGGSGIGLSVAKAIVSAHKGKITAKSKDGRSVEFCVTL